MITTFLPEVHEDGRYSVNEASKALGIHQNTLRQYTVAGYIRPSFRKTNMRPFYTGHEIKRFWKDKL